MSAAKSLKAVARDRVGKGAARAVRRNGQVPAVIYGGGSAPSPIALDANETRLLIFAGRFLTTIFEVDAGGPKERVIPRDYQLDPVTDIPLHVDFLRVRAGEAIEVEVPVHYVGDATSPGVKNGGTLNVVSHTLLCLVPNDAIPEAIEVDVSALEIGDVLHVSDVKLPAGVTVSLPASTTVVTIAPPSNLGEEAEAEEAAVTEAAKAESAAAAEPAKS